MAYLGSLSCLCVKVGSASIQAVGSLSGPRIKANPGKFRASISGEGVLSANATRLRTSPVNLSAVASVSAKLSASLTVSSSSLSAELSVSARPKCDYGVSQSIQCEGTLSSTAQKVAGDFSEFTGDQKLYPILDLNIDSGFLGFVNKNNVSGALYQSIDEGVFTGDYAHNLSTGYRVADDKTSYIQPSSIITEATFQYKCQVTTPIVRPDDSRFVIRASAPLYNYESKTPPKYTLYDIQFKDPSGNLITEYEDIIIRGDANHNDINYVNFGVYSSKPQVNNAARYSWDSNYPLMNESSGYTLSFNLLSESMDDAFDEGFTSGFEEVSSIYDSGGYLSLTNPTHGLKISAIEICSSGGYGPRVESHLNIYAKVRESGYRVERHIYPQVMPLNSFDDGIYPSLTSVWWANDQATINNTTVSGSRLLINAINNPAVNDYITLKSSTAASGKLIVKFGHTSNGDFMDVKDGPFGYGFDQSTYGMWLDPTGAFNTQNKTASDMDDGFFVVESVSLKVLAKKAVGSNNYVLDVVGYSDDKILNVTSAVGGFLQNVSGIGTYPTSSGFSNTDDLALDGTAISEREWYYLASGNNAGGDHYVLSQTPVISGESFQWYEIPLKVYDDRVTIGKSREYNMSSMFENLYLDLYPIPSGASIASMYLLVRYAPQNALNLITDGGVDIGRASTDRSEGKIYPTTRQSNDDYINAGSGYAPLSLISGVPHAYTTPNTLKSNYSRRWRGMEGTTSGSFDQDMFGFGFNNPLLDFPFLSGFYDFDNDVGNTVVPRVGSLTGYLTTSGSTHHFKNIGWRFTSGNLFTSQLPGYSGLYQTTDWTSLASGATNFTSYPLYGQIADAFNNVVRVSSGANINFGNVNISGGFSLYLRFSPDSTVSGVNKDLFQSGVLASKWTSASGMEFVLGYSGGYLQASAKTSSGTIQSVRDTALYDTYQYPLGVILTYNDHNSSGLKLYTDNEFEPSWTTLRASSVFPFAISGGVSNLTVGHSTGSGVGFDMFVSEMGISPANIVYSGADATLKEVTAQTFLQNNRVRWWDSGETNSTDSYTLWDNINEDTLVDWSIGDFKYCSFAPAFSQLTKRTGRDLVSFRLKHDGSGYFRRTNIALPPTVNSGVSYHTQIENDFLRFNLSDTPDNFYAVARRITKDLPRGYKFSERALVVETVLEHSTSHNISWNDGNVGPKLIVSLYTKRQEPYWVPTESNWGLINRAIHYLEPSSCIVRLDSKFDYNSLTDTTESWALFPSEPRIRDFKERYFSDDVDDMFLQYDLVYPSGEAFESRINIHSAHVRAEEALLTPVDVSGNINLLSQGGYIVDEPLNLVLEARTFSSGNLNLYTIGPLLIEESGLPLYTSGMLISYGTLNLSAEGYRQLSPSGSNPASGITLYTAGEVFNPSGSNETLNLTAFGLGIITSSGNGHLGIALTAYNDEAALPNDNILNMLAIGSTGVTTMYASMPIFLANEIDVSTGAASGSLNLKTIGSTALFSRYPNGSLNLYTFNNTPSESMNLIAYADVDATNASGSMNLFTANYSSDGEGAIYVRWFNDNYGAEIDLEDNQWASVDVGDEIRGVDLIGYGSCDGDSPAKAIDSALVTHDTVWRPETCNDGGIFRAIRTYTNIDAGYSGNYYGIRKYENLTPNVAYNLEIKITTGSTEAIPTPREWEEWEYGTNDTINYSGAKLVSDYDSVEISGRISGDEYGKKVVVKGDLLAVGSPFHTIPDDSGYAIPRAGTVYLYRRGEDVPGEKAAWNLEDILTLPSGYTRDYVAGYAGGICYDEFCVSGKLWKIGQEGREFGHSIDIAVSGDAETVVVGAPGAAWSRNFEDIVVSGIPICMMVFTDKFTYNAGDLYTVKTAADKWDVLYKYFSAPWNAGGAEFQPKIDTKLIICQIADTQSDRPPVNLTEDWAFHTYIDRLDDPALQNNRMATRDSMLSGVQQVFKQAFPHPVVAVHSGLPPILGVFEDISLSTSNGDATSDVVDLFIQYYEEVTRVSGVKDQHTNLMSKGYANRIQGVAEEWDIDSTDLINETLATGNLIDHDALKFITSGVGQMWAKENAYDFQYPPPSGGRVYIFQKESGVFNLVQAIAPPVEEALSCNDRFGHSVSISQNMQVLAIGSPFASEYAQIYEKDDNEESRMYAGLAGWLHYRSMTAESGRLVDLTNASGASFAQQTVYNELSQTNKFLFRSDDSYWDEIITPYKKVYNYTFSPTGTWQFIPGEFAGTTRLGYSSSVSDDGDIVVFGAPTDSFNEFDDTNVWYEGENTWASCINAGAVRVFEARKYYPHNKVVEFYRFGNLDMNSHPSLSAYYNQMGDIFSPMGIDYERLPFSTIEIPQEAGLAFIITPEIDAASDEIINNIKDWLALGDRTLVLVGNDPIYEDNGRYKRSNDHVNKILNKLGSRMKIVPARNSGESLNYYSDVSSGRYNVVPSFVPSYSHGSYTLPKNMYARGVGDIKIDLTTLGEADLPPYLAPCDDINYRCNMPIKHLGDLRAEWTSECVKTNANGTTVLIKYQENWPFHFSNTNPAEDCDNYPDTPHPLFNRPNEEPVPILAAAEWTPERTVTIPADTGSYTREVRTIVEETINTSSVVTEYADTNVNYISFSLYQDTEITGVVRDDTGLFSYDGGTFIDPDPLFSRDGLLQGEATSFEIAPLEGLRDLYANSVLAAEEYYGESTSKVIIIATLYSENKYSLSSENDDQNIAFYQNIAGGKTVQLGGFTGRESFTDAYSYSRLGFWLRQAGGYDVIENFDLTTTDFDSTIVTAWVANPSSKPTDTELNKLTSWLSLGGKRLVLTYDGSQESAHTIAKICDQLGTTIKPIFSESNNYYLSQGFAFDDPSIVQTVTNIDSTILINSHPITISDTSLYSFTPLFASTSDAIVYYNAPVQESYTETQTSWKFNDYATVKFDVNEGSGYRLFYNTVSETPNETYSIDSYVRTLPGGTVILGYKELTSTALNEPTESYIDFTVPEGISRITVEFDTRKHNKILSTVDHPLTPRLLSVSGCPIAINESIVYGSTTREVEVITYETVEWNNPAYDIVIPEYVGAIRTDNGKYCSYGECDDKDGQLIEDGPIVAAEEYENFSAFLSGSSRSRIILLTDSTMVQGMHPEYRDGTGNEEFIRSLYPANPTPTISLGDSENDNVLGTNARQFRFVQKIVAPERGSPGKYYAASGYANSVVLFGTGTLGNFDAFTDQENSFDPDEVTRRADPLTSDEIKAEITTFGGIAAASQYPRFSGVINGRLYTDARMGGGVPDLLRDCGKDYLDFDAFPSSGYRGDLFGYSVSLHNDKLLVGSPFNAFYGNEGVVTWSGIQVSGAGSGMVLSGNGGAGAAFYYERTGSGTNATAEYLPWEFKQKIRPSSINVGIENCTVSALTQYKGLHFLTGGGTFLNTYGALTDQFGYSVSIAADMMAIGAPCHDFQTIHDHIYSGSAAFIRKEFNPEFDIPFHHFYDLGSSGVRVDDFSNSSGQMVLNNGAVFTYLNRMVDWNTRTQRWEYAEKVTAQGYNSRDRKNVATLTSGNENDVFGRSVSLNRARRGDGDYSLAVGSPKHQFALDISYSGQPASGAGAAYVYDAMLREQLPEIPSSESYIRASVFGHKNPDFNRRLNLVVTQPTSGDPITYSATGVVFANESGIIYVEASGFDPAPKGFIAHRPYIESVIGRLADTTAVDDYVTLVTSGKPVDNSGSMNLVILGDDSATVYNTMNIYASAWNIAQAGSGNDPLNMFTEGVNPTADSGVMYMFASGIGTIGSGNVLNLRVRGK